jgi:hypothetical protein
MRQYADDRLLWLLVAGGLLGAYYTIPRTLQYICTLTEIRFPSSADQPPKQPNCDENNLKPSTLYTLATGPSPGIRASAIKIIADRFLFHGPSFGGVRELLQQDLSSADHYTRDRAINALWLLFTNPATSATSFTPLGAIHYFSTPSRFRAVVDALVNSLSLHHDTDSYKIGQSQDTPLPASPIRPPYRHPSERKLLIMIRRIQISLRQSEETVGTELIQEGLVTRWLSKYPFPCSIYPWGNYHREDVVSLFINKSNNWASDDEEMAHIIKELMNCPEAAKQLRECGLDHPNRGIDRESPQHPNLDWPEWTRSNRGLPDSDNNTDSDVHMIDGEETAGSIARTTPDFHNLPDPWTIQGPPTRRSAPERSQEEESLRRRHREAVVVAEPGVSFGPGTVLERNRAEVERE